MFLNECVNARVHVLYTVYFHLVPNVPRIQHKDQTHLDPNLDKSLTEDEWKNENRIYSQMDISAIAQGLKSRRPITVGE